MVGNVTNDLRGEDARGDGFSADGARGDDIDGARGDDVRADDVVAFRLSAHHLTERLAPDRLAEAAGGCAIQDSPPGSALLALGARVRDLTRERFDAAVADKTLLRTWSMRGAPFLLPAADAPVFTAGALPPTQAGQLHLIGGVEPALTRLGMTLTEAVTLTGEEIAAVLTGRRLAINELGAELAARIAGRLPPGRRAAWREEGPYAPGQPWGEAVVHFCLRILTLRGVVCFAPREGNKAPFVLVDEWLGHPLPATRAEEARAELLRRYLHCYGPSTRADFAAWLGVRPGDVGPWWDPVAGELTPVEFGGTLWILAKDLDALRSPPTPRGVRLLPARDPYTQARDRATIVDGAHHREVWRTVGEPGAVLVDGRIVGTWRPRKTGRKLTITVKAFRALEAGHRGPIHAEAERVGALRGASTVEIAVES